MDALVALAVGCVLDRAETRFTPGPDGWLEETDLLVRAEARSCAWIEVALPPGVGLVAIEGRERRSDDTKVKLDPVRFERLPLAVDGRSAVRVHVPDLLRGDRVELALERRWPVGPATWTVGEVEAVEAEVVAPGRVERIGDTPPTWRFDDGATAPERPAVEAPGVVWIEERLVLDVPPGDPQLLLYPGGGSRATREQLLVFAADDRARAWPLDVPADAEPRLAVEPAGAAELWHDAGGWRVIVTPSEASARVKVAWELPDAPTYGERGPDVERLTVEAPGGEVRWEGDAWYLFGVNGRLVLPRRDILVRALDARFRALALPEPGAPMELRGQDPSWELAAALRPIVWERSPVGQWPQDPVWPRKLSKARKSGALSPTEAALIVWLYARQLRLEADWALARPASRGPGPLTSPAGYVAPLVRVRLDGEERWIDPSCAVCAPFELPPDLEGADAIGPDVTRTPEPTPGRHAVTLTADRVTWELDGPPALLLRRWLATLPEEQLTAALAGRVGGPGARLVAIEGIDTPGARIRVVATRGTGLVADPLALPVPDPERGAWLAWVGERVLVRPAAAGEAPARFEQVPLTWERTVDGGTVREVLEVTDRAIPADLARALDLARAGGPPPTPATPAPVPASP